MTFNIEEIKKSIRENIVYTTEDTFLNHLKTFWRSDGKLTGMVNNDGFKVWASNWYLGGIIHVIVDGHFTHQKIILKTRINIAGRIFILLFLSLWVIATFVLIFLRDSSVIFSIGSIISWLLLQAMIIVPLSAGYSLERKNIISKVMKIINKV